jgi:hypothetical protein
MPAQFDAGRPFKFTDADSFGQAVNAYFDLCDPHVVEKVVDLRVFALGNWPHLRSGLLITAGGG